MLQTPAVKAACSAVSKPPISHSQTTCHPRGLLPHQRWPTSLKPHKPLSCSAQNTITLQWAAPLDNGSPITTYALERDDGPGRGPPGCGPSNTDFQHVYVGPLRSYTASGLVPGVLYRFRLRAENSVSAAVLGPAPFGVHAHVDSA